MFNNSKRSLEANIKLYLDKVYNFLELLALNIYLLSSSPLRGKAIVLLKFRNTSLSSLRNIFLDKANNLISIDTTNINKNDPNNTNLNTSNIRFLPIRLTKVLIYYITFIIPLIEYLRIKYLDIETIETRLFFKLYNKEISSFTLSKYLKTITKRYFKNPIGIKEYRHLITYIIKERIVKDNIELLSPRSRKTKDFNKDYTNIEDILANHSTKLANTNYTRETNYFSNKTRDITNRSLNFCKLYFNYFNLIEDRSIESILNTNLESSIASTNSSSLYTNKSKRKNKDKNIAKAKAKSIVSLGSSNTNLSTKSRDKDVDSFNIFNNLSNNNSRNSSSIRSKSSCNKKTNIKKNTRTNRTNTLESNTSKTFLTKSRLKILNSTLSSPSKIKEIEDYIDLLPFTLDIEKSSNFNFNTIEEEDYIPSTFIKETKDFYNTKENTTKDLERNINRFNLRPSNTNTNKTISISSKDNSFSYNNNKRKSFNKSNNSNINTNSRISINKDNNSNINTSNLNIPSNRATTRRSSKRSFKERESKSSNNNTSSNISSNNSRNIVLEDNIFNKTKENKGGRPKKNKIGPKGGRPKKSKK